jgi:alkylhydroperoxidase/carboxymuconolactone decarboxylase family protein YurZ
MSDHEAGFDPKGNEAFRQLFGEDFKPPFPRLPESLDAARPRRTGQRMLLGSDVIDLRTRALTIFTVMTALGFKAECKLYMQGLMNLGFTTRQIAELAETIGLYAGVPRAVDAHMLLKELVDEDAERPHSEGFYYVPPKR